jgi:hypothetical protein
MFMKPGQLKPGGETSAVPGSNISASLAAKRRKTQKIWPSPSVHPKEYLRLPRLSPVALRGSKSDARERERTNFLSEPDRPDDFALSAPRKNPRHDLLEGIKRQGKLQIPVG